MATFWKEFGTRCRYEVYFNGKVTNALLKTRAGDRMVGAGLKAGKGAALLLPPVDFADTPLVEKGPSGEKWTKAAEEFGKRLLQCIVEIAKAIASDAQITPPPDWAGEQRYRLAVEAEMERSLQTQAAEIERLRAEREALKGRLMKAGGLRSLLFEKGPQLEAGILEALRLMGFQAEPFADGESEFDAVFTSAEGRFLGEAEGKDNHSINIDKLSQLERNIQEDFAREEVTSPAKGVLFGNAFRLQKPEERDEFFTKKCLTGAARSRIALVRTPDLFAAAHYLKENQDPDYAAACRLALLQAEGREVQFPSVPPEESTVPSAEIREVSVPANPALNADKAGASP